MAERNQLASKNECGSAGEPPLSRARFGDVPDPRWTMNSSVRDVLLDGARLIGNQKLRGFIASLGIANVELAGDVQMSIFVNEPEVYITDENRRGCILSLPECQKYAFVYRVVPLLRGKGITSVQQWGGADENADAKRAVKDELADERLWNSTRGLLDAAFNAAKDAEAREERIEREIERERERIERENERESEREIEIERR
ncbi:putative retrotransposon hot spot protein 4 (RHS4) [Trypanosoma vivax]|nr:putative retrotransposon hot spot protein 4 (RHS4) [Trypanosoma vivax]